MALSNTFGMPSGHFDLFFFACATISTCSSSSFVVISYLMVVFGEQLLASQEQGQIWQPQVLASFLFPSAVGLSQ
jgi:hypothetical protein